MRSFDKPKMSDPTLAERAIIAQQARKIMAQHMANSRVTRDIKHNTPEATSTIYNPGDRVLILCEKKVENRIGEWLGPYVVVSVNDDTNIILVQKDTDSPIKRFSVSKLNTSWPKTKKPPTTCSHYTLHC